MNARILEIVKTPSLIQENDLGILEKEIRRFPFMQSLRALYLYGLHHYKNEDYASQLTTTAAFTTDKKILYSFIKNAETNTVVDVNSSEKPISQHENSIEKIEEIKETVGSIHPILDKEEEIHVEDVKVEKNEIIVEESSAVLEEDTHVEFKTKKTDEPIEVVENITEAKELIQEKLSIETENDLDKELVEKEEVLTEVVSEILSVVDELKDDKEISNQNNPEEVVLSEEKEINNPETINFHGVEDFLPTIIPANTENSSDFILEIQSEQERKELKQKEEMQRLIAEVEAKMKAKKAEEKPQVSLNEDEITTNHAINFSENHDEVSDKKEITSDNSSKEILTESTSVNKEWTPLNLSDNSTQGRFSKISESSLENDLTLSETNLQETEKLEKEGLPISIVEVSEVKNEKPEVFNKEIVSENLDSNIPQFINTWHSWLKLDKEAIQETVLLDVNKTEDEKVQILAEVQEEKLNDKVEVRTKAIESFIENEPKISRLKEENDFVYKDRGDDISHLMTETLVNLYVEQRLYAKAIRGFEILIEKHPEKKLDYNLKIEEVKNLRNNPRNTD